MTRLHAILTLPASGLRPTSGSSRLTSATSLRIDRYDRTEAAPESPDFEHGSSSHPRHGGGALPLRPDESLVQPAFEPDLRH